MEFKVTWIARNHNGETYPGIRTFYFLASAERFAASINGLPGYSCVYVY